MWDISGILTEEDRALGFSLKEDEDFVQVFRHGELLATFSSHSVTREKVRQFLEAEGIAEYPGYAPRTGAV